MAGEQFGKLLLIMVRAMVLSRHASDDRSRRRGFTACRSANWLLVVIA